LFGVQHPSAAEIYVDIGAVDFLSQLRPNVDPSLHRVIDSILDNLFHLPTVTSADSHGQHECIYRHQHDVMGELILAHVCGPCCSDMADRGIELTQAADMT